MHAHTNDNWDDWQKSLLNSTKRQGVHTMQSHTMTFQSFREKSFAVHWIKEHIDPDDFDECLTQLKIAFFTGVQPSRHTVDRMLKEVRHASYESHDF